MNISILNPLSYPDWDSLLETSDQTNFFQTAAWARVLVESYGYRPLYFTLVENGRLGGLLPVMEVDSWLTGRRGVSLPFSDLCHPVTSDHEVFKRIFEAAVAHGRRAGWKYLELRGGARFLSDQPAYSHYLVHTLELSSDEAEVRKLFKSNALRNIRKAEREGVSASMENSPEAMAAFYKLHCGTRRYHGLPPQPWSFFENIFKYVIAAGKGFVFLAVHAGKTVAAVVCATFRRQVLYKFGASDRGSQHLRPNNLVMWEAVRWACRSGMNSFHFGRTEPENEGLRQFKRSWGTAEAGIQYFKYIMPANTFATASGPQKVSYGFFKLMPLPMLRLAGGMLYRHVG